MGSAERPRTSNRRRSDTAPGIPRVRVEDRQIDLDAEDAQVGARRVPLRRPAPPRAPTPVHAAAFDAMMRRIQVVAEERDLGPSEIIELAEAYERVIETMRQHVAAKPDLGAWFSKAKQSIKELPYAFAASFAGLFPVLNAGVGPTKNLDQGDAAVGAIGAGAVVALIKATLWFATGMASDSDAPPKRRRPRRSGSLA